MSSKLNLGIMKFNLDRNSVGQKPKTQPNPTDNLIKTLQKKYISMLANIQAKFRNELDKLYQENFEKIEEINKTFNYEIYKSNTTNNNNYNKLINDKNAKINEIENEFIIKKNYTLVKFTEDICKLREEIINEINKGGKKIKEDLLLQCQTQQNSKKKNLLNSNNNVINRREWKI